MSYSIRQSTVEDSLAVANLSVASWQAAYKGIIDEDVLISLSVKQRAEGRKKYISQSINHNHLIMENQQQEIIGFSDAGPESSSGNKTVVGEIYTLYVHKDYQGQGIGRQLLQQQLEFLKANFFKKVVVWAFADNLPAHAFYSAMGGVVEGQKYTEIGEKQYKEISYVWEVS